MINNLNEIIKNINKFVSYYTNWWKTFVKKHIIDKCPPELDDIF